MCQTNKLIDKYGKKKQPQLQPLYCQRKREKEFKKVQNKNKNKFVRNQILHLLNIVKC
jgi:hypothetical protein